jgi:cytochrome c553
MRVVSLLVVVVSLAVVLAVQHAFYTRGPVVITVTHPPAGQAPITEPRSAPTAVPTGLTEIVAAKCLRCHGPHAPDGLVDLSDLATISPSTRWRAYTLVNHAEMPQVLPPLSDEDVVMFYEWAELGSPQPAKK